MDTKEKSNEASSTMNSGNVKVMSDRRRVINLAMGDALVFLIFSFLGRRSHSESVGPDAALQIVLTALPFAAGWFLVSPFMGAFRRGLERQPRAMAIRTALAWVPSCLAGLALRGIFVDHAIPPATFAGITFVFNLGLLELWRWPFAFKNTLN